MKELFLTMLATRSAYGYELRQTLEHAFGQMLPAMNAGQIYSTLQAVAMVSLQGVAMKRPSRIHISIESRDGAITRVRVGGKAVKVAEGKLLV